MLDSRSGLTSTGPDAAPPKWRNRQRRQTQNEIVAYLHGRAPKRSITKSASADADSLQVITRRVAHDSAPEYKPNTKTDTARGFEGHGSSGCRHGLRTRENRAHGGRREHRAGPSSLRKFSCSFRRMARRGASVAVRASFSPLSISTFSSQSRKARQGRRSRHFYERRP